MPCVHSAGASARLGQDDAVAKYVPRSRKLTSHVSAGLLPVVLLEVDRRAAVEGVTRARYLGRLVLAHVDELDTFAKRAVPADRKAGPHVTIAATVGADGHGLLKDVAQTHGVTVSRLVAVIVNDGIGDGT